MLAVQCADVLVEILVDLLLLRCLQISVRLAFANTQIFRIFLRGNQFLTIQKTRHRRSAAHLKTPCGGAAPRGVAS